ncbi:hypothetical protein SAMN05444354_11361 [Stigmatella aurantiaca]|uniref:Alginate lyase domain-containing protein n=1 Tax=Stigmatella aurantiaca TaxID=41 RepID=A0A1H7WKB5_STIAU|nr:hypothetical protein [Stigmatella aurantiaca]SEM22016.1 hypothetical protein SAMN05444354_11361 [Stigmatella aurantiaca]
MLDLEKLAAVPNPPPFRSSSVERGIADSVAYLGSETAQRSLERDPYWPKWDSPWWHMLLLHELGEARQIPARASAAMVVGIDRLLHLFPIHPSDAPGADLQRDSACHCALGTMYPVLAACGIDVERALPWVRPWFVRYQMADGGLNCDPTAYLQTGECPSSMVGTVAPLEAMLPSNGGASEHSGFVSRAAGFLIERALIHGSRTVHNAGERGAAGAWRALTFPRFYFYDVLRGLAVLVRWAETAGQPLPEAAISAVVTALTERWPDGIVHVERQAHAKSTTILPSSDRSPSPRAPASTFPLLDATSQLGEPSEALTRQWTEARAGVLRLAQAGRLVSSEVG